MPRVIPGIQRSYAIGQRSPLRQPVRPNANVRIPYANAKRQTFGQCAVLFWAKARSSAELFPGVLDGLSALRQKYPIALCTSSSDKDAEAVFSNTGLDQFFETIVTSDRVANLKPDPSPYLLACRELGMNPAQCVALEDSPAGVTAAKRAGLYGIGLTTSKEPEELKGAHIIFPETRQAMDWILELQ